MNIAIHTHERQRAACAGLAALIVLQGVMLGALYAGVEPHPPRTTPLFAIAPFLGSAMAAAVAAWWYGPTNGGAGRFLAIAAVLAALVSFGPQKYFDAQISLIWPAVVAGQLASIGVLGTVILSAIASSGRTSNKGASRHVD